MIKKIILTIALLTLLGAAFALFRYVQYQQSPDKAADIFMQAMTAGNTDAAYEHLSDYLKQNYSREYWNEFFAQFAGYDGSLTLSTKQRLQPNNSTELPLYDQAHQPWRLVYDLQRNDLTYQLEMIVFKPGDQWRINEFNDTYLPPQ
jgi:hypothetical protein